MNIEEIKTQIKEYLLENIPNQGLELSYDTDLLSEWFIDSLGTITTILFLEKKFGLTIKRADINADNFTSINTISTYVFSNIK